MKNLNDNIIVNAIGGGLFLLSLALVIGVIVAAAGVTP